MAALNRAAYCIREETDMDHLPYAETTNRLSLDERYELVAHLLRLPSLFSLAQSSLNSAHFDAADEPHLRVVWKIAKKTVNDMGLGVLSGHFAQARNILQTAARAHVESHPIDSCAANASFLRPGASN
jgi:hypothetical protein